jgi:RNA polymerase sigma factor (sigma-70 family)
VCLASSRSFFESEADMFSLIPLTCIDDMIANLLGPSLCELLGRRTEKLAHDIKESGMPDGHSAGDLNLGCDLPSENCERAVRATESSSQPDCALSQRIVNAVDVRERLNIRRYIRSRCFGQATAEEIDDQTQEVFLRFLKSVRGGHFSQLSHGDSTSEETSDFVRGWLFKTASHVVSEFRRSSIRRSKAIKRVADMTAGRLIQHEITFNDIAEALKKCTAGEQSVILLLLAGKKVGEVASLLKISRNTVTRRRKSGALRLARVLGLSLRTTQSTIPDDF